MTRYPLYFVAGDDETRVFKYLDSDGVPVSLVGFTATWSSTIGDLTASVSGTVDGLNGKVTVSVDHTKTAALGVAGTEGSYELVVTSGGGLEATIASGPLVMFTP